MQEVSQGFVGEESVLVQYGCRLRGINTRVRRSNLKRVSDPYLDRLVHAAR
jgi:hypothetical protein